MNKYICYIYYNEDWEPYYVGKGSAVGRIYGRHDVMKPGKKRTQIFYFNTEWEAYECEEQLIGIWKRQCDGGCLYNRTFGGPGVRGRAYSPDERHLKILRENAQSHNKAISKATVVRNIETGEVRHFPSMHKACEVLGLSRRNLYRKVSKGWELVS